MLELGAPVAEIDATAAPALELVARWQITEYTSALLLTIVVRGPPACGRRRRRGGRPWSSDPVGEADPTSLPPARAARRRAGLRVGSTRRWPGSTSSTGSGSTGTATGWRRQAALAAVELWAGLPARAAARLDETLASSCPPTTPPWRRWVRRGGPCPRGPRLRRSASAGVRGSPSAASPARRRPGRSLRARAVDVAAPVGHWCGRPSSPPSRTPRRSTAGSARPRAGTG